MPRFLALTLVASSLLSLVACGDDDPAGTGGGDGSGGAASASTSTTAGPVAVSSSTSGAVTTGEGAGPQGSGGQGGTGGGGACTTITPDHAQIFFASIARSAVEAPVDPPLDGAWRTRLTVELYEDDGSGELPPLEPGTYDLSEAPDDNYGTCQHCVLLVGQAPSGQPIRAFMATEGTMTIDTLEDGFPPAMTGSLEGVVLAEATQNPDFTWELIPGGECVRVEGWSFGTEATPGAACESQEACGNEIEEICDPDTGTCGPEECTLTFDGPFCAESELCLPQLGLLDGSDGGPAIAACYEACEPYGDDVCPEGEDCVPLSPVQEIGACFPSGGPAVGEACTLTDIGTGCEPGAVCRGEPPRCLATCDYLTATPDCPDGTLCSVDNTCRPPAWGDAGAVDEDCDPLARWLQDCGEEDGAFRGLCMSFYPEDVLLGCERMCRTAEPDCPGDQECLALFSNPAVGICRDPAVCGDGELDVIGGELCDDGGTEEGDGCNGTCDAVDLTPLCASAPELDLEAPNEGTNAGGASGYTSACDPYVAMPTARYAFTPPGPGTLRLRLASEGDLGLSILGDCDDPGTEIACRNTPGDDAIDVNFVDAGVDPALVVVRGVNPEETSDFVLDAEFIPAVCGDGLVGGVEVCDDGGTEDGDGCAADCSAVVWGEVCEDLPELPLDRPFEGDTSEDGSTFFDLAGICSWVGGSGKERAFSFVAPEAGTLAIELQQTGADLSLFVMDECGPPSFDVYLTCSNSGQPGTQEQITTELEADQRVTVIVDGFTPTDAGEFTLEATFTP